MRQSTYITLCWTPVDLADVTRSLGRIIRRLRACDDSPEAAVLAKRLTDLRKEVTNVAIQVAEIQPKWEET